LSANFRLSDAGRTIVFIDEIHRFNKAQQDAFLPRVEAGDIVLIGATTENPSFEVNSALLSRSKVFVLPALERDAGADDPAPRARDIRARPRRGIELDDARSASSRDLANGDARQALNLLQLVVETASADDSPVGVDKAKEILQRRSLLYDKSGEEHYNIISALHKSMRNSDADAAVYWLVRMLEGGEDPLYIARRLVRFASEDIGNADPQALVFAIAGVALAQLVTYLTAAPKSNAAYVGYGEAVREVRQGDNPASRCTSATHPRA
jgi:putative ATPase